MFGVRAALVLALAVLTLTGCSSTAPTTASTSAPSTATTPAAPKTIALPAHPRVYFFGDSWTHGFSADPGRGFPYVVGEALGWSVEVGPNESGAGYVHTYDPAHPIFPDAAKRLGPVQADLVVIEGGLNDIPGSPDHKLWESVLSTVQTIRAKAGGAPIVMVGPASPDGLVSEGLGGIDFEEAGVAKQLGVPYVSPIDDHWFNPTNVKALVDPKTGHPNTAGHAYYGGRLASALAALTTTAAAD